MAILSWAAAAVLLGIITKTTYTVWRMWKCPECYWGDLRVLCSSELQEALRNGNYRTATRIFSMVHLRCGKCRELYLVRPDHSLERTELPIPAPRETDEERI